MGKDIVAGGDLVIPAIDGMAEPADPDKAVGPDAPGQSAEAGVARRGHRGMVSAEWAVGIVAAVAIAGVLLAVVTSGEVQDALLKFLLWVIKGFISVVD
jgi:hypothetical protein